MSAERAQQAEVTEAAPATAPVRAGPGAGAGSLGNRLVARLVAAGARGAAADLGTALAGNAARGRLLRQALLRDDDVVIKPAPQLPYQARSSELRTAMMTHAATLVPATEGEDKFYRGVSAKTLKEGREFAAAQNTTYTDCIDFVTGVYNWGRTIVKKKGLLPSPVIAPQTSPAFVPAVAGMPISIRPSPGDIFIMHSGTKDSPTTDSGKFAHTGVIKSVVPGEGSESWTSYDGGQGSPSKLEHLEITRTYDPATNMYGGKVLFGWFDVDLL